MNLSALPRTRPVPTLVTAAFVLALAVTVTYFAGLVPGVPKTLSTFVNLIGLTVGLLAAAGLAWAASYFAN